MAVKFFTQSTKYMIEKHLAAPAEYLDIYPSSYARVLILGDFNFSCKENFMNRFCVKYDLKTLKRKPTCHKNSENPTCIVFTAHA